MTKQEYSSATLRDKGAGVYYDMRRLIAKIVNAVDYSVPISAIVSREKPHDIFDH